MGVERALVAFLAATLVLVPCPGHWRTRNLPLIFLAVWLFLTDVISGTNALLWSQHVRIRATLYCDIGQHLSDSSAFATIA